MEERSEIPNLQIDPSASKFEYTTISLTVPFIQEEHRPALTCPHCLGEANYEQVTFVYNSYRNRGHVFTADVQAYVCQTDNLRFYLPEVSTQIDKALVKALEETGYRRPAENNLNSTS